MVHAKFKAFLLNMRKPPETANRSIDVTNQMASIEQKIPDGVHEALLYIKSSSLPTGDVLPKEKLSALQSIENNYTREQ